MESYEVSSELDEIARRIIGAAIEVHRELGPGFLESVYEEALCIELERQRINHQRQYPIQVNYKGHMVGESRLDILVEDCVVVELKAVEILLPVHIAQVMSYLKASNCQLGLLMNFNVQMLKHGLRRVIWTNK